MEPTDPRDEPEFIQVELDDIDECYRDSNGEEVNFAKMVTVRECNALEAETVKLSFTRDVGYRTDAPVPCVRLAGEKFLMSQVEVLKEHVYIKPRART